MNKKILIMTALLIAALTLFGITNSVMASECTAENCKTNCKDGCNGKEGGAECDATCCPVEVKSGDTTKCYPTLEDAAGKLQSNDTITLRDDVQISKMVTIGSSSINNITFDLGDNKITAANNFSAGSGSNGNTSHILEIEGNNITVKNGSIVTTSNNKHGINVYHAENVVLVDLDIDHTNSMGGAPIVVNGSSVKIEGEINLTYGTNSWYGIDVDPKDKTSASVEFEDNSSVAVTGNENKPIIYQDPPKDNKTSTVEIEGDSAVSIQDGSKTTLFVGHLAEEAVKNAAPGSHVKVEYGNLKIANLPSGVTFDGAVTVTNPSSSGDTVETIKNNLQALIAKAEGEENASAELTNAINTANAVLANHGSTYSDFKDAYEKLQKAYDNFKNAGIISNNQPSKNPSEGKDKGLDTTPKTGDSILEVTVVLAVLILANMIYFKMTKRSRR